MTNLLEIRDLSVALPHRSMISARGISPFLGVSSMLEGLSASGSMPTCASSVRRRGEALASTSFGFSPARRPPVLARASSARRVSRRGLSVRLSAPSSPPRVMVMRPGLRLFSISARTLARGGVEIKCRCQALRV